MTDIVEIGSGKTPFPLWLLQRMQVAPHVPLSTQEQWLFDLLPGGEYTCVDRQPVLLAMGASQLRSARHRVAGWYDLRVDSIHAQAHRGLPIADTSVDVVVLSDVLSLPEHDKRDAENGANAFTTMISTRAIKAAIIKEAARMLRPDGVVFVQITCTPQFAAARSALFHKANMVRTDSYGDRAIDQLGVRGAPTAPRSYLVERWKFAPQPKCVHTPMPDTLRLAIHSVLDEHACVC
jgi:SAM-dependent methyltransferase